MSESPAERVARKEKQAREAPINMARYRQERKQLSIRRRDYVRNG